MTIGEDKNKVRNVLIPLVDDFRTLYGPLLEKYLEKKSDDDANGTYGVKVHINDGA